MRSAFASLPRSLKLALWCITGLCGARAGAAQAYLGAPVVVPTATPPTAVYTADVNGDSVPDLIYIDSGATATASTTHVLLGDGKGGFTQSAVLATAGTSVAVGKLLGTGRVDIGWLTSSQQTGGFGVQWHIAGGVGDGTFAAPVEGGFPAAITDLTRPTAFSFMKVADQSGQANTVPSIVAVDKANGYVCAFVIQPIGLQTWCTELPHGTGPVTLGDLNGDTYDDIVVDGLTDFTAQTYLGEPSSSGGVFTEIAGGFFSGNNGVQSLALADFNGDGKLDMAAEDKVGRIEIFAGNGDGTFQSSSIGGTMSVDDSQGDGGYLIAAADVNGDGISDLLTYTPLGVSVELGTASGNYALQGVYPAGTATANSFVTADFNRDGAVDVALNGPTGIVILYGKAAATSRCATPVTDTVVACPEPSAFEQAFTLSAVPPGGAGAVGTVGFSISPTVSTGTPTTMLGSAPVVNGVATLSVSGLPLTTTTGTMAPIIPGQYTVTAVG